jgi:phage shock protein C
MADMNDKNGTRVLARSRDDRMLAGVCAGVAGYFGIDATLVRVIWAVLSIMTGGAGVLAYLAAWVIIPEAGQKNSVAQDLVGKNRDAWSG